MAHQLGISDPPSSQARFADAFVIFSVTVLSMALGAWFLLQLGLSLWPGMAAALTVYTVLLLFHLLVRRALLDGGSAARDDMHWVAGETELGPPDEDRRARPSLASSFPDDGEPLDRMAANGGTDDPHRLPDASAEIAFHYRPRDAGGALGHARPQARVAPAQAPRSGGETWQGAPSPSPSEKNVELIQDLIKKLADELSDPPASGEATGEAEDAMIARSLAALDTTAQSMRAAGGESRSEAGWWQTAEPRHGAPERGTPPSRTPRPPTAAPQASAAPPLPDPEVARAAEAIAANRLEIMLEPIQALSEGRARHFEISWRFLAADATGIELPPLAGSGLLARMNAAGVIRAARVAQRLGERGREGDVLTAIGVESLTDPGFLDAVIAQAKTARGMGLILSLSQASVRVLTDVQMSGLSALKAAGCRFALEEVADLKLDFAVLKAAGFAFVKLEAPVFLEGLPATTGRVAASDLCRFLGDFGLTLIVGRIEDDWMLARILGFGVQFGMGGLFGGPKLVKAEVVGEPAAA